MVKTMEELKTKVLMFIEENQSFEGILSETYDKEQKKCIENVPFGLKADSRSDVSECVHLLKIQAKRAACSLELLAAESLAKQLSEEILSCHENHQQFLNKEQSKVLSTIIKIINDLLSEKSFNRVHFAKCLSSENSKEGQSLPMEVLWKLHACHILSFNTYLACCSYNSSSCHVIVKGLIDVCNAVSLSEQDKDKQESMLSVFLGVLVTLGYKEKAKEKEQKRTNLEKVAEDIVQGVIDGCSKYFPSVGHETDASHRLEVFEVIRNILVIPKPTMTKFFSVHLHQALFKSAPESQLSNAVMNQNKWNYSNLSEVKRTRFQQFLYMFKPENIMQLLSQAFSRKEVDWTTTLSFLAVFLVCEEDASKLIKDYTDHLMEDAFTNFDVHTLSTVLLVVRQSALEGPHVFPSYLTWFKSKFGDVASSSLNNKKAVQFFFQLLNEWVPYEPAQYLKVQIIKSPEVPSKLRTFVHDYIALAKTRLMDLKEPIELTGMYDHQSYAAMTDGKTDQTKQQEKALKDVEKVLESYQKTGKVPGTVMEASIFRKPYFIGRFLPALLTPRKLPDTPDTTAKLIKTLSKAGKIPINMQEAYQKACEKMEFDHNESSSEDDSSLTDIDKLNKNLRSLTFDVLHSVQHADTSDSKTKVSSRLSLLSGHMKAMVKNDNANPFPCHVILDVHSPGLDCKTTQIGDALLNAFCRTCMAVRNLNHTTQLRFKWAVDFVAMVISIPAIQTVLYYRLWDLLCSKGADLCLTVQHTQGLAAFLCHLSSLQQHMTQITLVQKGEPIHNNHNGNNICSFVESIFGSIPFTSYKWMEFTVRLSSAYLQHAAEAFNSVVTPSFNEVTDGSTCIVPTNLIKKLWYSAHRLSFCAISWQSTKDSFGKTMDIIKTVKSSSLYRRLLSLAPKVSFEEWLTWEMMICRQEDILSDADRCQYHEVTAFGYFLPMSKEEGGCDNNYKIASSIILDKILGYKQKSHHLSTQHSCSSNCSTNNYKEKEESGNMVPLLKKIIHLFPNPKPAFSSQAAQPSWLLEQYYRRIERMKLESKEDASDRLPLDVLIENETRYFILLILQLPVHLLFCDNKDTTPSQTNVSAVACFVNDALRVHAGYLCCLPLTVTTHILKYTLSVSQNDISSHMSVFHQFSKECPIFFVSLQYYWEHINIIVTSQYGGFNPLPVLTEAKSLHDWTISLCSGLDTSLTTPTFPSCVVAASVFLVILKWDSPTSAISKLQRVIEPYTYLKKVLVCLFGCVLSSLMETLVQGHEIWDNKLMGNVAKELLECCPEALLVFENERKHFYSEDLHRLRTLIVPDKYTKLQPLAFFSLLLNCRDSLIKKVSPLTEFSHLALKMNRDLAELRQACIDDQTFNSCEKPFQVDFSKKVRWFMDKYVGYS